MLGRHVRILGVTLLLASCGSPNPKAPEAVREHHAQVRASSRLDRLKLDPEKRAEVNALVTKVRASFVDYERARLALLDEVVIEIAQGKLVHEKVKPLWEEAIRTFRAGLPDLLLGINRLHELLSRAEREQLVEIMSAGSKGKNADEKRAEREERLGRILDLRAGQKTTLYPAVLTVVIKHYGFISRTEDELEDAEEAFIGPDFDARELALIKNLDLDRMAEIYFEVTETVLNHLTPEQHQTLSAVIDARLRGEGAGDADH